MTVRPPPARGSQEALPTRSLPKVALPIDRWTPDVLEAVRRNSRVLVIASPGSGKTTRLPWAISEAFGKVYVLEPRRIAAKLSAERVAEENGFRIGEEIGYQFRFERRRKDSSRLVFLTEGTLLRELQSNPTLKGISVLVLDEFHERHLQADLALSIAKRLQETTRPDLKIVLMSATLDAGPLERFLPGSEKIEVEAPRFPIEIEYAPRETKLEIEVRRKVSDLLGRPDAEAFGDLLVFLPGMAEIRRAESELRMLRGSFEIHVLHGEVPREAQDRALGRSNQRKVILSTNIAESSVTIPGVNTVIDAGMSRIASFSHTSGLPRLETKSISRASAIQRAGRAGRTAPGRVVRLYSRGDFDGRPVQETPEILRSDLAPVLLDLLSLGYGPDFGFFESPAAERLEAGWELLADLGFMLTQDASDGLPVLSETGKWAAESSFHPRITRALIEAAKFAATDPGKGSDQGTVVSALLAVSEGESLGVDFLEGIGKFRPEGFQSRISDRMRELLDKMTASMRGKTKNTTSGPSGDELISRVILAGFPDRVGRRKGREILLARGGSAETSDEAYWTHSEYHLVLDLQETKRSGELRARTVARSALAVTEEWLWEVEPLPISERTERVFDEKKKIWETWSVLALHDLVLSRTFVAEKSDRVSGDSASNGILPEAEWETLFSAWLSDLKKGLAERDTEISPRVAERTDAEAWTALVIRYRLLRENYSEELTEGVAAEDFASLLRALMKEGYRDARASRGFPELEILLEGLWSAASLRKFKTETPAMISLPGRKRVPVHYEDGGPVRIESRMQEFFSLAEGPKILGGRLKLSLHLLAPNYRAVQMTEDLRGFWERHYPALRKELMRKYPRHSWPENPLTAAPTEERRPMRKN
ncbi:MAG: DEAD/DEAH box helicase [Cryobacterium sp.]|nr:DEAD/DEAH box helicase [Oligoflexia bacterium]